MSDNLLLDNLKKAQQRIMDAENSALASLEAGDTQAYILKMHEKANLLASLYDELSPYFNDADPFLDKCGKTIRGFSNNANMALELDSVFFMSALLYPDDHKKGEPNNLQILVGEMEKHFNA